LIFGVSGNLHSVIAVAGATGYIGNLLALHLAEGGEEVVALARSPEKADDLKAAGCEVRKADVLEADTLGPALKGVDVAYYLVHSMGRGSEGDFASNDIDGARNFAAAAAANGVKRIVYLGGLGSGSEHLNSRHATAVTLRAGEVPVTYFRAAAVLGAGSESFRTVYYLVRRLPAMITPKWTSIKTQPIAVDDIVTDLAAAADLSLPLDREIQIGGPDVTTYGGMIDELAKAMDKRAPIRVTVPVLTPRLSSLWIGLVTPVDPGVAQPLIEGLSHETIVEDQSGMKALPARKRIPLDQALRAAVANTDD
jgi:uncharacterized protein YbjT (DUF2867 family)